MIYLSSLLIIIVLSFLELSFLPYFSIFHASAFITLAFLVALSVRNRDYFQIFLALVAGLLFDFAGQGLWGQNTLIFILTMLLGRLVFYQKTSYKSLNSFIILLLISTSLIYLAQLPILFDNNFIGWQSYLMITCVGIILTLAVGLIIYRIFDRYFNWLEAKTEK